MTFRFVGATGAVRALCDTPMIIPAMLIKADRVVIPAFAGIV
jgi:hypothetical protein